MFGIKPQGSEYARGMSIFHCEGYLLLPEDEDEKTWRVAAPIDGGSDAAAGWWIIEAVIFDNIEAARRYIKKELEAEADDAEDDDNEKDE